MNLTGSLDLGGWIISYGLLFMAVIWAVKTAPWYKVQGDSSAQAAFGLMAVVILLLWSFSASIHAGIQFHFLLMTLVTLMFGPQFAFLLALIVTFGLVLSQGLSWDLLAWNVLLMGGVPIAVTWWLAKLAYRYLDRSFFVFVLLNGFFAAALGTVVAMLAMAGVMLGGALFSEQIVVQEFVRYIPVMALPEGFLNGFLLAGMILFKPEWLACFSDEVFLQGK